MVNNAKFINKIYSGLIPKEKEDMVNLFPCPPLKDNAPYLICTISCKLWYQYAHE
jgi:hypothetical protein